MSEVVDLFSIPLYKSFLEVPSFMEDHVNKLQKKFHFEKLGTGYKSRVEDVLEHKLLLECKNQLLSSVHDYFYNVLNHTNDVKFELIASWFNLHKKGQWCHEHSHTNSTISGVWYIDVTEDSGDIAFIREQNIFGNGIEFENVKDNHYNRSCYIHKPKNGDVLIFPSIMKHYVYENMTNKSRISLPFNCVHRGTVWTESAPYIV